MFAEFSHLKLCLNTLGSMLVSQSGPPLTRDTEAAGGPLSSVPSCPVWSVQQWPPTRSHPTAWSLGVGFLMGKGDFADVTQLRALRPQGPRGRRFRALVAERVGKKRVREGEPLGL